MHQAGVERVHGVENEVVIENCPAIYSWVKPKPNSKVPSGTKENLPV